MGLTREQMIADCGGEAEAAKYAEGARELCDRVDDGRMSADDAWAEMRWELGAGTTAVGVSVDDPFLTDDDRVRLDQVRRAASHAVRDSVRTYTNSTERTAVSHADAAAAVADLSTVVSSPVWQQAAAATDDTLLHQIAVDCVQRHVDDSIASHTLDVAGTDPTVVTFSVQSGRNQMRTRLTLTGGERTDSREVPHGEYDDSIAAALDDFVAASRTPEFDVALRHYLLHRTFADVYRQIAAAADTARTALLDRVAALSDVDGIEVLAGLADGWEGSLTELADAAELAA